MSFLLPHPDLHLRQTLSLNSTTSNQRYRSYSQLRLDALKRRDRECALCHTGTEAGNDVGRARDLAFRVGQHVLVGVEGDEADAGLERVADDEGGAAGVPLRAERRPRQLLALGQPPVQLRARLCELGRVGDGDLDGAGRAAGDDGAQRAGLVGEGVLALHRSSWRIAWCNFAARMIGCGDVVRVPGILVVDGGCDSPWAFSARRKPL